MGDSVAPSEDQNAEGVDREDCVLEVSGGNVLDQKPFMLHCAKGPA